MPLDVRNKFYAGTGHPGPTYAGRTKKAQKDHACSREGMSEHFLTPQQAADLLQVHIDTLRKWARKGLIPKIVLPGAGRDYRFSRERLLQWAEERTLGGAALK